HVCITYIDPHRAVLFSNRKGRSCGSMGLRKVLSVSFRIKISLFNRPQALSNNFWEKTHPELTARLQRLRMRLRRFVFTIEYVSGKCFYIPDTLSRPPLVKPRSPDDTRFIEFVASGPTDVIHSLPCNDATME